MFLEKLVDERALGRGWVRVLIKADSVVVGHARCSIERLGLREPYLGRGGWQVASHFLDIEIAAGAVEKQFGFLLGPEVVRHMSTGSNYQLTLTDVSGVVLGSFPAPWRGVPGYSPPAGSASPAVSMSDPVAQAPAQEVVNPVSTGSVIWGGTAVSTDQEPALSVMNFDPTTPSSVLLSESESVSIPTVSEPKQPIFKIDCPHGPHKIMSNMVFCPICSKPV
jgi:hypothetical protein